MTRTEFRAIRQALCPTTEESMVRGDKRPGGTAANWDAEKGITQGELAVRLGVTLITVSRWETGLHPISEPIARLMRVLAGGGAVV